MQRKADKIQSKINNFLQRHFKSIPENSAWTVKKSELGGFGIFATRPIETGEVVFKDHPVILGPRAAPTCPLICAICYRKDELKTCEKCGLFLCSECNVNRKHHPECELIKRWRSERVPEELGSNLVKVLCPIRSLLLDELDKEVVTCLKTHKSDKHGFEVDIMKNVLGFDLNQQEEEFMRLVCSAMDANAFEVIVRNEENQTSVRGLYPLASLANHSCVPNTFHVFDENHSMVVRASCFIEEGSEITHSYSRFIWGTQTRRFHLFKTKHFLCSCERCKDPTEFGTYTGSILCKSCKKSPLVSVDPLNSSKEYQCEACLTTTSYQQVAKVTSILGSVLMSFTENDLQLMLNFLRNKLSSLVPDSNEVVLELKYRIIWILGYSEGYRWSELDDDLLRIKDRFCREFLETLEKLKLGQCTIQGLMLYELYCCRKEMSIRNTAPKDMVKDHNEILRQAANILMYDVGSPAEIKEFFTNNI